jgi:hypothetical protein
VFNTWIAVQPSLASQFNTSGEVFDVDLTPDDTALRAVWTGFHDRDYEQHGAHGIVGYEAGYGQCADWQNFTLVSVGNVTEHTFAPNVSDGGICTWETVTPSSACRLQHNSTYCAVVRAIYADDLKGPRKKSDGIRVCTLGPTAGTVSVGIALKRAPPPDKACDANG